MNCPNITQWNLLSMELVGEAESAELMAHARTCEGCRSTFGRARKDHATLMRAFEVFDRNHDRLRDELLDVSPAQRTGSRSLPVRESPGLIGGRISRRRWAFVLAPAACVLIAVGIFLVPGKRAVAFPSVLDAIRLARTMVCDYSSVTTVEMEDGNVEEITSRGTLSMSLDDTVRAWRLDLTDPPSTQWSFPDHYVHIDAQGKRTVVRLTDDADGTGAIETPGAWLGRLLELRDAPDRELGRDMIGEREAVGFQIAGWRLGLGSRPKPGSNEVADESSVVRLWVDVDTRLPVRLDMEEATGGFVRSKRSTTLQQVQWDMPLDARDFRPPPPEANELVEEKTLDIPAPTEESFIEGLRALAAQSQRIHVLLDKVRTAANEKPEASEQPEAVRKLLDLEKGYPPRLDLGSLSAAAVIESSLHSARAITARARGDMEAAAAADEEAKRAGEENARSAGAVALFYRKLLLEDREPEYFGSTVKPGDGSAVLMRWKLDDEYIRVIYGDLRVETVRGTDQGDSTRQ